MAEYFEEVMNKQTVRKEDLKFANRIIPAEQLQGLAESVRRKIEMPQTQPKIILKNSIFPKTLKQEKIIYRKPQNLISNRPDNYQ